MAPGGGRPQLQLRRSATALLRSCNNDRLTGPPRAPTFAGPRRPCPGPLFFPGGDAPNGVPMTSV